MNGVGRVTSGKGPVASSPSPESVPSAAKSENVFEPSSITETPQDKLIRLWRAGAIHEPDLKNTYAPTFDNRFDLHLGQAGFDAMFRDVEGAKSSINVSYYMFIGDEVGNRFADLLIKKANEGVEVNVMVDAIGSKQHPLFSSRKVIDKLEENGVNVFRNHMISPFNSAQKFNHPDHRKLVIVDGKKGYTGGMNIGKKYVDEMHDWKVSVEGSAAQQMQSEFLTSWVHVGKTLDKSGRKTDAEIKELYFPKLPKKVDGSQARVIQHIPGENREILEDFLDLINEAKTSLKIEVPYLTNGKIQKALREAAKRGVDVTVILPAKGDNKFTYWAAKQRYPGMINDGVKVYEYPGFSHGKVLIADGEKVSIGSSNMDDVALRHVYELNVATNDKAFAERIDREIFDVDVKKSRLMKSEDVNFFHRTVGFLLNRIFGRIL